MVPILAPGEALHLKSWLIKIGYPHIQEFLMAVGGFPDFTIHEDIFYLVSSIIYTKYVQSVVGLTLNGLDPQLFASTLLVLIKLNKLRLLNKFIDFNILPHLSLEGLTSFSNRLLAAIDSLPDHELWVKMFQDESWNPIRHGALDYISKHMILYTPITKFLPNKDFRLINSREQVALGLFNLCFSQ